MALQITSIPNISFESSNNSPSLEKIGGKGHHSCLNLSNSPCRNIMLQLHQISTLRLPQSTLDIQLPSPPPICSTYVSTKSPSSILSCTYTQVSTHTLNTLAPPPPSSSPKTGQQRNRNAKLTLWHILPSRTRTPSNTNRTPPPSRFRARNNAIIFPSGVLRFSRTRAPSRRARGR